MTKLTAVHRALNIRPGNWITQATIRWTASPSSSMRAVDSYE